MSYKRQVKNIKKIEFKLSDEKNIVPKMGSNAFSNCITTSKIIDSDNTNVFDDGLFSLKIFGPIIDYTCKCVDMIHPKPKSEDEKKRCPLCDVEIGESYLRKENIGYIELAEKLTHPIFKNSIGHIVVIPPGLRSPEFVDSSFLQKNIKEIIYLYNTNDEFKELIDEHERIVTKVFEEYYDISRKLQKAYHSLTNKDIGLNFGSPQWLNIPEFVDINFLKRKIKEQFSPFNSDEDIKKLIEEFDRVTKNISVANKEYNGIAKKLGNKFRSLTNLSQMNHAIFLNEYYNIYERKTGQYKEVKELINIGDINYLYRKIIDANNQLKYLKNLKNNKQLYDIYKYCVNDFQVLLTNTLDGKYLTNKSNKKKRKNKKVIDEPIEPIDKHLHSVICSGKGLYAKIGFVKLFHSSLNILLTSSEERMPEEDYNNFRKVYNLVFAEIIMKSCNEADRKISNRLEGLRHRYKDEYDKLSAPINYNGKKIKRSKKHRKVIPGFLEFIKEYKFLERGAYSKIKMLRNVGKYSIKYLESINRQALNKFITEIDNDEFIKGIIQVLCEKQVTELQTLVNILIKGQVETKNQSTTVSEKDANINSENTTLEKPDIDLTKNDEVQESDENNLDEQNLENQEDDDKEEDDDTEADGTEDVGTEDDKEDYVKDDREDDKEDGDKEDDEKEDDDIKGTIINGDLKSNKEYKASVKDNVDGEEDIGSDGIVDKVSSSKDKESSSNGMITMRDYKSIIKIKSLYGKLKGKNGHFRKLALGKRQDYSGRSVIIVEPNMRIDEVGLPFEMAMILFEQHIIEKLKNSDPNKFELKLFAENNALQLFEENKVSKRLKDFKSDLESLFHYLEATENTNSIFHTSSYGKRFIPVKYLFTTKYCDFIWVLLEKIIRDKVVLLVRNPSLHRMNVGAFKPRLTFKKAIKFHPLVLKQFGADIDGDTMAVFLPLFKDTQEEAKKLMLSGNYVFSPANGEPVNAPSQDMLLGLYYLTKQIDEDYDKCPVFSNINEAITSNDIYQIQTSREIGISDSNGLHKNIKLRHQGNIIETTMGRAIFNSILPNGYKYINYQLRKKSINELIKDIYECTKDVKLTNKFLEDLKDLGLRYATSSGLSIGLDTVKDDFLDKEVINKIEKHKDDYYNSSKEHKVNLELLRLYEKYFKSVADKTNSDVFKKLETLNNGLHPLQIMLDSGARGTREQLMQILGIKGYLNLSNSTKYKNGFNPYYFVNANISQGYGIFNYLLAAQMARKLNMNEMDNVPKSGYLTRKMALFLEDVVVNTNDCNTNEGININLSYDTKGFLTNLIFNKIYGRYLNDDVIVANGEEILKKGELLDAHNIKTLENNKIPSVNVRSPLKCKIESSCCRVCYGLDLALAKPVKIGTAIGILAAQSIGEPSTQLILKNFHTGGVTKGEKIEDVFQTVSDILNSSPNISKHFDFNFPSNLSELEARFYQKEQMAHKIHKTFNECGAAINQKHIEVLLKQLIIKEDITVLNKDFYNKGARLNSKSYSELHTFNKKIVDKSRVNISVKTKDFISEFISLLKTTNSVIIVNQKCISFVKSSGNISEKELSNIKNSNSKFYVQKSFSNTIDNHILNFIAEYLYRTKYVVIANNEYFNTLNEIPLYSNLQEILNGLKDKYKDCKDNKSFAQLHEGPKKEKTLFDLLKRDPVPKYMFIKEFLNDNRLSNLKNDSLRYKANIEDEPAELARFIFNYQGINTLPDYDNCAIKKLSFQNLDRVLKNIIKNNEYEDFSSMASRKIIGKTINAGTGMVGDDYFDD